MKRADRAALFAHFQPDEHAFAARCLDWIQQALFQHIIVTTPFLDPRQQEIFTSLARREPDLYCESEGGIAHAERRRMQVAQTYLLDPTMARFPDEWPIAFLRVTTRSGEQLEHRQIMGSLLAQGMRRDQVGDLIPHSEGADLIVTAEIKLFICLHLQKVGKESVDVDEISPAQVRKKQQQFVTKQLLVGSLRLDAVLARGFDLSREKAGALIRSGKCRVNWQMITSVGRLLKTGDLLSLRGYGRLLVGDVAGETKKGKIRLLVNFPT
jgi:RNA-binding protein YlmH